MTASPVTLPPLRQHASPNQSPRTHGITPYLIVVHRPVGSYDASLSWLSNPRSQASAHILTDSNRDAVQLVPWDRKAWACASFNSVSYNLEIDDNAWNGKDPEAFDAAARIVAFLCKRTGIPPYWTSDTQHPGFIRHLDLGRAGGGHTDPTESTSMWLSFSRAVHEEYVRGRFRPTYGVGELKRIDV